MGIFFKLPRLTLATFAILAFMAVFFIDFFPINWGGYASQRILLLFICGWLVIFSGAFFALEWPVLRTGLPKYLVPVTILCIGFLIFTFPYREQSYVWVEPGMYGFFFLAVVATGYWISSSGFHENLVNDLVVIVIFGCGLYGLATINIYIFVILDNVIDLDDYIPWGFVNIRYWSHIATWCVPLMPLALLVGPLKHVRLWRAGSVICGGLWWWMLILSVSRGSVLGISFGVLAVMLLFGKQALPWLKVFFAYLITGLVIWTVLSLVIPLLLTDEIRIRTISSYSSGRMPLFGEAWAMSLQSFPLGMGPQSWLTHGILTEAYSNSRQAGHPHNMYLMWAAEYGWALIALFGLLIVQAARYFMVRRLVLQSEKNSGQALMLIAVTASVVAALFHAIVSAVFLAPGSMLVGLFVLVAFWALIIPHHGDRQTPVRHGFSACVMLKLPLTVGLVLFVLWLLWMNQVWRYYEDMQLDKQTYLEETVGSTLPRFWYHGNFPRSH